VTSKAVPSHSQDSSDGGGSSSGGSSSGGSSSGTADATTEDNGVNWKLEELANDIQEAAKTHAPFKAAPHMPGGWVGMLIDSLDSLDSLDQ
jgi:hypothetical protein